MLAHVDPFQQRGVAAAELSLCLRLRSGELYTLPNLIETARVAIIADAQVTPPYPQPARDPDIDGIGLGDRSAGTLAMLQWKGGHRHLLDLTQRLS